MDDVLKAFQYSKLVLKNNTIQILFAILKETRITFYLLLYQSQNCHVKFQKPEGGTRKEERGNYQLLKPLAP